MIISDFGKRVRSLRTQREMSQEKFALLIGMDRSYLASVESGKRNISLENVYKIASGFDISLERFRFVFLLPSRFAGKPKQSEAGKFLSF